MSKENTAAQRNDRITVTDLSAAYGGRVALSRANFTVPTGSLIGIVGPNGGGKSTLLKAMVKLIPTLEGTVDYAAKPFEAVRKTIAYMPQRNEIDWDFPIDVLGVALLGAYPRLKFFARPGKANRVRAQQCLDMVHMGGLSHRQIGELSGGQQQRVFVARALMQDAQYLLLDEPFSGIDAASEEIILSVLQDLKDQGKTIFVVHHDLLTVRDNFDYTVVVDHTVTAAGRAKDFDFDAMALSGRGGLGTPVGAGL